MLTKKVRFTNFYDKKNIKQINNRLRNFKKINFIKEYPFLICYSKSYKYGYSKVDCELDVFGKYRFCIIF